MTSLMKFNKENVKSGWKSKKAKKYGNVKKVKTISVKEAHKQKHYQKDC